VSLAAYRDRLVARIRAIPSWQVTLGLALLVLGFLIAAQLASEGPRIRYTSTERSTLTETVVELQRQQDTLRDQILALRERINEAEQAGRGSEALVGELTEQLEQARIAAGLIRLQGTGIIYQLEDSTLPAAPAANEADYLVTARDVRTVVEELWLAGAEAVAVNGERVVQSTAIVDIGGSVLINSAFVSAPYQVSAIGPVDLYDRVSASQGFQSFLAVRSQQFGIRIAFVEQDDIVIPEFAGTVGFTRGRPIVEETAAPASSPEP
jgi:uncharacterized protein YlxW (UPF0749 family)